MSEPRDGLAATDIATDDWDRVKRLFDRAVTMHEPAARRAFLDRECAGEAALRASVEALLGLDAETTQWLRGPIDRAAEKVAEPAAACFLKP